jgi:hypothetical protein
MTRASKLAVAMMTALSLASASAFAEGPVARAGDNADTGDSASLFASGVRALHDGRAPDAVAAFEALADRGVVDAVASYDRALAYALRVRLGDDTPGDLGRAAHGFEEARELSSDGALADDASRALVVVRTEVARRRQRAGQPVEVDPSRSLARALSRLLSEDVWSVLAAMASLALAVGLFMRWLGTSSRARVAGGVTAGVSVPALVVSVAMTLSVRHDRMNLREAVIVSAAARPTDERGIALPGASPLPEGARVEVLASEGPVALVRFGAIETRIAPSALRELARRD